MVSFLKGLSGRGMRLRYGLLGKVSAVASAVLLSSVANAAVHENVTLGQLIDFLEKEDKSNIEFYAAEKLREKLEQNQRFFVRDGQYVDVKEYPNSGYHEIKDICTRVEYYNLKSRTTIDRGTNLRLQASAIDEPIKLTSKAKASIAYEGNVRVRVGVKKPDRWKPWKFDCSYSISASTSKKIVASVSADADLKAVLNINPTRQRLSSTRIRYKIEPTIEFTGKVTNVGMPRFQVISGGIAGKVISKIDDLVFREIQRTVWDLSFDSLLAEYFADKEAQDSIEEQQQKFTEDLAASVLGNDYSSWSYGQPIVKYYDLPWFTESAFREVVRFINNYESHFPISHEFLENANVQNELYMALLSGDVDAIKESLASSLACQLSSNLTINMPRRPTSDYVDVVSYAEFCAQQIGENSKNLGNAEDVPSNGSPWMITPGTSFDIGVKSIAGNNQPYMKRERYKTVRSKQSGTTTDGYECWRDGYGNIQYCAPKVVAAYYGDGYCELEMRVYKKDTRATGLKPLMAIHGGSYKYRGFGYFGLESQISHFTDRGFVVFAPFYRLVGTSDGNTECQRADGRDLIADAKDALKWVEDHASEYGASGKVKLFGQSAGAHLAAYLATHQKSKIDRAWLVYPPLDFGEYLYNWSENDNPQGTAAISGFLAHLDFETLADLRFSDHSFIRQNSLPDIVDNAPETFPRMFMMHGVADDLVPVEQSEKMCEALGGSGSFTGGNPGAGSYRSIHTCGNSDNKMHLFAQAGHIMDMACLDERAGIDKLCLPGSEASENAIEASYNDALTWLNRTTPAPVSTGGGSTTPSIPSGSSCQWQIYTGSGGQGWSVQVARPVGECKHSERVQHFSGSTLTRTEYK